MIDPLTLESIIDNKKTLIGNYTKEDWDMDYLKGIGLTEEQIERLTNE